MYHKGGISLESDVLDLALLNKLIIRSGAWFKYGDTHLGQGREKVRQFLIENPQVLEELRQKIVNSGVTVSAGGADAGE
jgi:recombination protein RecA